MSTQFDTPASIVQVPKTVFISYSRRDKAWVDDYLLPLLSEAEVPYVIDKEDFELGALVDECIRKWLNECHYTLFVMTPDWVDRKWTHYEAMLALDSLSGEGRRILPIKLKTCEVPPDIATRLFLDLCAVRERDDKIVTLLKQLGVSADRISKALNRVATKTLAILIELLEEPQVRAKVSNLRGMFLQIQQRNEVLVSNKQLHDDLQVIQSTLSQVVPNVPRADAGLEDWRRVRSSSSMLSLHLEILFSRADSVGGELVDVAFVDFFRCFPNNLNLAIQSRDQRCLASILVAIGRLLDRSLPKINDRIFRHVREQFLGSLANGLQEVYEAIHCDGHFCFDADTTALIDSFREGIARLTELDCCISELANDHFILQEAEVEFQQMIRGGEPTYYDIALHWERVVTWVSKLKLVDRYKKLLELFEQLTNRLRDDNAIRDDQFEEFVKWDFNGFVDETRMAFNKLDCDLLDVCKEVKPHGDEIQQVLNRMRNDDTRN